MTHQEEVRLFRLYLRKMAMTAFEKVAADWGLDFSKTINEDGFAVYDAMATGIVFGSYLAGFEDGWASNFPTAS